jgi:hypothetical protein
MRGHVFSRLRERASFANVTASLAMFIALGGSSYAAVKITGADVRNGSLSGRDIRNESIKSRDVRGLKAADFRAGQLPAGPRWLLINESGDIEEQSGGFTVISKPGINGQPPTNPNIYVSAGSSLIGKGLTASIAIQNRLDRNGDMVADPAFNGDVAVGRCNTSAINCVPANTNNSNTLVVRALVDNASAASQTRRVWVQVTS